MSRFRLVIFIRGIIGNRLIPVRYYLIEFFCYVVSGISFYKDYGRFYRGKNFLKRNPKYKINVIN